MTTYIFANKIELAGWLRGLACRQNPDKEKGAMRKGFAAGARYAYNDIADMLENTFVEGMSKDA